MKQGFGFKVLKTAGTLLAAAVATGVHAAPPVDTGLITFDGAVSSTTCTITTANGVSANNLTINMPVVAQSEVEGTTVAAGGVGHKDFELMLSGCPLTGGGSAGTDPLQATIAFSGQFADLSQGTLHADSTVSGSAQNVNIALYNNTAASTSQVKIGDPADVSQLVDLTTGSGTFAYRAAYVPGSAWVQGSNDIVPGIVSTNTIFTVTYQ